MHQATGGEWIPSVLNAGAVNHGEVSLQRFPVGNWVSGREKDQP